MYTHSYSPRSFRMEGYGDVTIVPTGWGKPHSETEAYLVLLSLLVLSLLLSLLLLLLLILSSLVLSIVAMY